MPSLPALENLACAADHFRTALHPQDPLDLQSESDEDFIPQDFLNKDIKVDIHRHLHFATDKMIQLLSGAKNWYVDAAFKVIKAPLILLFSILAFVKQDECIKQIPLMFLLMSQRKRKDYKKAFQAVKAILPSIKLKTMTMDFEAAVWKAARSLFPMSNPFGCGLHWSQAVWQKEKLLGLQKA